jgi:hypothetical protein
MCVEARAVAWRMNGGPCGVVWCDVLLGCSEHENVDKLEHAMRSLKAAMKWDEDKYGLEYDLDVYNIVAVRNHDTISVIIIIIIVIFTHPVLLLLC